MAADPPTDIRRRALWSACLAHALHDGYTDLIYVLLPVWQADFGLGYAALALLRTLNTGTMAALQLPAARLAERLGGKAVLTMGTLLAALGFACAGLSGGLAGLCAALALSGCGSTVQHPIASSTVSHAFGGTARGPLGVYNFAGDLGKAALPGMVSLLLTFMSWRHTLWIVAAVGLIVTVGLAVMLPRVAPIPATPAPAVGSAPEAARGGFTLLLIIGILDTAVRMSFLLLLPFLLKEKGASVPLIGLSLTLVFVGGAAGKFLCGWLGGRMGVVGTVAATECGTALGILAVLLSPLAAAMLLLPLVGVMLNGTSSVLYGTVPDLVPRRRTERAFAVFYTGTIGSGAIAPIVYGVLGDALGVHGATYATCLTALAVLPLAVALGPRLRSSQPDMQAEAGTASNSRQPVGSAPLHRAPEN